MQQGLDSSVRSDVEASNKLQFLELMMSIGKTTRLIMGLKLTELGLHNGQDELLLAIQGDHPLSVTALAQQLNVRPSTVSKMLDRLVERGLVTRLKDDTDARRALVQITPVGQELMGGVVALHKSLEADLAKTIVGDPGAMLQAIAEIDELLKQRLRRLR